MVRRYKWIIAAVILAGVVFLSYGEWNNRQRLANALESNYQRDFYTVLNQVGQLEALLGKGLVSNAPGQQVFFLTEVWGRANTAQTTLGQLPFMELNLAKSRKFLAQLGDYAYVMAKKVANGEQLATQQREQLLAFQQDIKEYAKALRQAEKELHETGYRWAVAMHKPVFKKIGTDVAQQEQDKLVGFKDMEQRFDGLPTLIYDGPFSDGVGQEEPKGLAGEQEKITQQEAEKIAEDFVNQGGGRDYKAIRSNEINGNFPAFGITLDGRGNPGMITCDVSSQGGQVLSFLNSRFVDESRLSKEEAEEKALAFLEAKKFSGMEQTFGVTENNTHWLVFTVKEGGVRIYPDQLKLQVALDDGEIIGFDGMMYFMNHQQRELPEPKLSSKEAMSRLSPDLTVKSNRLALIPLSGNKEVLTYEFLVEYHEEDYLVYINALTGDEENILKLIIAPEGELTI